MRYNENQCDNDFVEISSTRIPGGKRIDGLPPACSRLAQTVLECPPRHRGIFECIYPLHLNSEKVIRRALLRKLEG